MVVCWGGHYPLTELLLWSGPLLSLGCLWGLRIDGCEMIKVGRGEQAVLCVWKDQIQV